MQKYNPKKIEPKWQRVWGKQEIYKAKDFSKKPKLYLLVEFPYPSGAGLHVGHCRSYTAMDVIARKRRMQGFNVLFPMGWDAFGLPTENYAIKTGIHPRAATKKNTAAFKKQEKALGLSFDWSREINTTDPAYYKWTQWIFLQMFKHGLAYKKKMPINWCPSCKIGLANEEVVEGKCERCGKKVERREKEQWLLKITKYAERLIRDLDLVDFPERVKALQKDWIGKSEGVEIKFPIANPPAGGQFPIKVFTTRLDTIFGCTYLVLAPEHQILEELKSEISNFRNIAQYIAKAKTKLERERLAQAKEKTGVKLEGVAAINPATGKQIPIFVADYILMHYGTGAIMAVPGHDQRDLDFAKKYNLPVVEVIKQMAGLGVAGRETMYDGGGYIKAYDGEGVLVNSRKFNGLKSELARQRMGEWFSKKGIAKRAVHYKLRDWIFSRQRYWGEPIPLVKCEKCGWVPVPEKELPVALPNVKNYKPTEKGESPLAGAKTWVNTKCPKCKEPAKRETDVMPNWAGSNWYYLAYTMPRTKNEKLKAKSYNSKLKTEKYEWDKKKMKYWLPVDWYNGGMEHTTLHLLYSRFIYKFLWDIGAVPKTSDKEPYKKRTSHGMILGQGNIKMSKSKGNVINPEDVIKRYGADTLRVYEMFMGPFSQAIAWDDKGVRGVYRFLQKIYKLSEKRKAKSEKPQRKTKSLERLIHQTIKKVSEDIENMKFNTAVASLMVLTNTMFQCFDVGRQNIEKRDFEDFLKILSPFAPHLSEELWQKLGNKKSICLQRWPKYDTKLIKQEKITLIVQVNGRVRDKIEVAAGVSGSKAKELALRSEKVKKWLSGKKIKKTIFVPNKLINFVI